MTERREAREPSAADPFVERLRRPLHFGTLLGASAGLYATTLTGVSVLQQQADDGLGAARAPAAERAAALRTANDELARIVERLDRSNASIAGGYAGSRIEIDRLEGDLEALASVVGEVRGAAAALPDRIPLPSLPRGGSVRVAKPPATHATTRASGG
ncbi:MAG TPA: hypothetical protein VFV72_14005 [Candidatus Limnocylindrales bacterium]|nr:hypothetical protein [Candidatus Limnocylindrales bacterium]